MDNRKPIIFAFNLAGGEYEFSTNSQQEQEVDSHELSPFTTHSLLEAANKYGERLRELARNKEVVFVFNNAERDVPKLAEILKILPSDINALKVGIDEFSHGMMHREPLATMMKNCRDAAKEYAHYCQQTTEAVNSAISQSGENTGENNLGQIESVSKVREELICSLRDEAIRSASRADLIEHLETKNGSERLFVAFDLLRKSNEIIAPRHINLINLNNERRFGCNERQLYFSESNAAGVRHSLNSRIQNILFKINDVAADSGMKGDLPLIDDISSDKEDTALLLRELVEYDTDITRKLPYLEKENFISLCQDLYNKKPQLLEKMENAEITGLPEGTDLALHGYIKNIIKLRALKQDMHKLTEYTEKFEMIEKEQGCIRTPTKYANALTGRETGSTGGDYNFNSQGMPEFVKSVLVPPLGKKLVSIDFSSMEVAVAAAVTGNQPLLNAYNQGKDIYAAFGLQAKLLKQNANAQTMSLDELFNKVDEMKEASKDNPVVKEEYDDMRSLGKSFVLPKLYGSGSEGLANSNNISKAEADLLGESFNRVFPEVELINQKFDEALKYAGSGMVQAISLPLPETQKQYAAYETKATVVFNDFNHYNKLYGLFCTSLSEDAVALYTNLHQQGVLPSLSGRQTLSIYMNSGDKLIYEPETQRNLTRGSKLFQNIIQSVAAAVVREFTDELQKTVTRQGLDVSFVLNIHDEINMLVEESQVAELTRMVESVKRGELGIDASKAVLGNVKWRGDVVVCSTLAGEPDIPTSIIQNSQEIQTESTASLDEKFFMNAFEQLSLENHSNNLGIGLGVEPAIQNHQREVHF